MRDRYTPSQRARLNVSMNIENYSKSFLLTRAQTVVSSVGRSAAQFASSLIMSLPPNVEMRR